jgi:hypothetical protein
MNPLHAPTYHSLAELEARVFNVEGLARLNKKAALMFNSNAMQPSPLPTEAWSAKIRARKHNEVPQGVAALAQKIVEEDETEEDDYLDPFEALESMSTSLIEDDHVGGLLQADNSTVA